MQLSPEIRATLNVVIGYADGRIRLRDRVLESSSVITAQSVRPWPVESVAALTPADLDALLDGGIEVVLLATGARQTWPAASVLAAAAARGVGLEVMDLGAACRTYNVLLGEDRPVALAAILAGGA